MCLRHSFAEHTSLVSAARSRACMWVPDALQRQTSIEHVSVLTHKHTHRHTHGVDIQKLHKHPYSWLCVIILVSHMLMHWDHALYDTRVGRRRKVMIEELLRLYVSSSRNIRMQKTARTKASIAAWKNVKLKVVGCNPKCSLGFKDCLVDVIFVDFTVARLCFKLFSMYLLFLMIRDVCIWQ